MRLRERRQDLADLGRRRVETLAGFVDDGFDTIAFWPSTRLTRRGGMPASTALPNFTRSTLTTPVRGATGASTWLPEIATMQVSPRCAAAHLLLASCATRRRAGHPDAISGRSAALLLRERGHERLPDDSIPASGRGAAHRTSAFSRMRSRGAGRSGRAQRRHESGPPPPVLDDCNARFPITWGEVERAIAFGSRDGDDAVQDGMVEDAWCA